MTSKDIVNIFLRAVQWKKRKRVDVLGGDKLSYVTEHLVQLASKMDGGQLMQTAMATVNSLQATTPANIHASGVMITSVLLYY